MALSLLASGLAGCQSGGDAAGVLGSAAKEQSSTTAPQSSPAKAASAPAKAGETLGKGPSKVVMLLPLSASGVAGERARKLRDGGAFAMSDLGNDLLTLRIEDTRGDEDRAKKLVTQAIRDGDRLLIGPGEAGAVAFAASLSGPTRPVVLSLSDRHPGAPGVYAMQVNEADSAAAAAGAVASLGAAKFVLLVGDGGLAKLTERRVADAASRTGGSVAVTVTYSQEKGAAAVASEVASLIPNPDAVVVATGGSNPEPVVDALRKAGVIKGDVKLVGTNRWTDFDLANPALQGAYLALPDAIGEQSLASRFRAAYKYEPDANVAIGYDSVALAAGITSSMGPTGLRREAFENPQGFRGASGHFRFRSDGGNDKELAIFQIIQGRLRKAR